MSDIQKLEGFKDGGRPETGPMQFGDDWPGVFIRGDNALAYSMSLSVALDKLENDKRFFISHLKRLLYDLRSCKVG